jgi:adenylyltransferase/sulfurtransferase
LTVLRRGTETHVHAASRPQTISALDDPDGVWYALLTACDGVHDLAALRAGLVDAGYELPARDLHSGLDALAEAGFLVDGPVDLDDPWANQRAYLEQFAGPEAPTDAMLAAVRDTSVLVLGAGGVGSWLAHALALMGVRQIVVVDPDVVEPANLTRQLYTADAVGTRKIEALGASLRAHRPDLAYRGVDLLVTDPADLVALLDDVDVVAGCADQPSSHEAALLVARACVASRTPHTAAVYSGSVVRIGPTWMPRRRPPACHGCVQLVCDRDTAAWSLPSTTEARDARPHRFGVTVAQAQLVASLAASEILHLRAGLTPATTGHVVALDLRTLRSYRSRISRQRDCDVCGTRTPAALRGRHTAPTTWREEVRV